MSASVAGLPYAMQRTPVSGDIRGHPRMHGLDQELEVLDARRWRDAVSEVEDVPRPPVGATQDVHRAGANHVCGTQQHSRVEVALHPAAKADAPPPLIEVDVPVERHDVR